jgi:hypothetical protein
MTVKVMMERSYLKVLKNTKKIMVQMLDSFTDRAHRLYVRISRMSIYIYISALFCFLVIIVRGLAAD